MADLSPILAELEKLYSKLGGWKGLDVSNPPVITLASKGRKRTQTGWYNAGTWVDSQEDTLAALAGVAKESLGRMELTRGEIVLATELLSDPVQTATELYKQAIIHANSQQRGGDTKSLQGAQGYYPEQMRSVARQHEFRADVLADQPSRGWAGFVPADPEKWERWVRENMDCGKFEVSRNADAPLKRAGSRMKKWRCDCTVIRSATKVTATCHSCGKLFTWAEPYLPPRADYYVAPDQADALAATSQNGA